MGNTRSVAIIKVVDNIGREMLRMNCSSLNEGVNELPLDVSRLSEGSYYVILESGGEQYAKSLKIMR